MPDITVVVTYAGNACYVALVFDGVVGRILHDYGLATSRAFPLPQRGRAERVPRQVRRIDGVQGIRIDRPVLQRRPPRGPATGRPWRSKTATRLRQIRSILVDRFQRDVLGEMEHWLSWVYTMIKSAPDGRAVRNGLGYDGRVRPVGQVGPVSPTALAGNIMVALTTTALGLTIAIPLIICTNSIQLRIRKLEELVGYGLARILETIKQSQTSDVEEK